MWDSKWERILGPVTKPGKMGDVAALVALSLIINENGED